MLSWPLFGYTPMMRGISGQRGPFGNTHQGTWAPTQPRKVVDGAQLLHSFQPRYLNKPIEMGPSAFYARSPYDPMNFQF